MGNLFFWWGTDKTDMCHVFHMHMNDWVNFEEQIENKLEVNSNRKTITRNATQIQPVVTCLSEIKILRSTHR
jgi:hypothetical protein